MHAMALESSGRKQRMDDDVQIHGDADIDTWIEVEIEQGNSRIGWEIMHEAALWALVSGEEIGDFYRGRVA
jgi:hypothetical protein